MRVRIFQPQCYGVRRCVAHGPGYAEVVFIQPGGKLDTMIVTWCLAKTSYPTSRRDMTITNGMVTAAGRCSLLHRQKHRNLQRENLQFTEPKTFFPPNSPDLNMVNLPSGVLFSRRYAISSKFLLSVDNEKSEMCQKHGRNPETTAWSSRCQFITFITFLFTVNVIHQMAKLFSKIDANKLWHMMFKMKRP